MRNIHKFLHEVKHFKTVSLSNFQYKFTSVDICERKRQYSIGPEFELVMLTLKKGKKQELLFHFYPASMWVNFQLQQTTENK